jgi:hypothetical protein
MEKADAQTSRPRGSDVPTTDPRHMKVRGNLRQRLSQAFRHEEDFNFYIRGLQLAGLPDE